MRILKILELMRILSRLGLLRILPSMALRRLGWRFVKNTVKTWNIEEDLKTEYKKENCYK